MRFKISAKNLSVAGVCAAVIIVTASGTIGLISLNETRLQTQRHIEALDMARSAQIELEKQFTAWKSAVYRINRSELYQKDFLEYSQHMAIVQDLLFNIKVTYQHDNDLSGMLGKLKKMHNEINSKYVKTMVLIETSSPEARDSAIQSLQNSDTEAISLMETIVTAIKKNADYEINQINNRYFRIILASIIILFSTTLGMGSWTAHRIIKSHQILSGLVKKKTQDLVETHKILSLSEQKYRLLVEGSNDVIFTLDKNLRFVNCNNAVYGHFNISSKKIAGLSFKDLLYADHDNAMIKNFAIEKISNLILTKKATSFNAIVKSANNIEQKEMRIHLEYIDTDESYELLGRAEDVTEDTIIKYQNYETASFSIDNYLLNAEEIASRASNLLNKFMHASEVMFIKIGLREMIVNAIEHGNLGITFEEKSKALSEDTYFDLINNRRTDPQYKNKKVRIDYKIDGEKAIYKITDEGNGFDTLKHLMSKDETENIDELAHGRGITMTRNSFDKVIYNSKGNQVLLTKNLLKRNESEE